MVRADETLRRRVRGVRRDEVARKKEAGSRSWKLMNSTGQEMDLDEDKYTIMRRVQVHARDLRILDPLLSYPPTILSRDRAIVLNLEHIKAIITAEEVLLRDQLDDNVIPVVEELRRRLKPLNSTPEGQGDQDLPLQEGEEDESPFEFTALDVALEAICSYLAARGIELETAVYPAMEKLTAKVTSRKLDEVRKLKSQVTRLTARVQKVRDELKQLLNDDDDMAKLYLSKKLPGASSSRRSSLMNNNFSNNIDSDAGSVSQGSRASVPLGDGDDDYDVEELEVILEAYFTQIDGTLEKLTMLRDHIANTEDYINLQLDKHRNQLMEVEFFLSLTLICLSIYSTVAQLFGMSIPYSWNFGYGYLFKWVVITSGVFSAFLFIFVIYYARRRRVIGSYT